MRSIILAISILTATALQGQDVFITKTGNISFHSEAPMEDITAKSNQVTSLLNTSTGAIAFVMLVKTFKFKKALMQEHFNENYMESHKFPKAKFTGKITNLEVLDLSRHGAQQADISGEMTIHGVTRDVSTTGTLELVNEPDSKGAIAGTAKFKLLVKDYNIKIPKMMVRNIAEEIEVTVHVTYYPKVD